jgi:hypothetical protein
VSLELGDWKMNDSGFEKSLKITSIDPTGFIDGTLDDGGQVPGDVSGYWDETSRTLGFMAYQNDLYPRFYRGVLFSTPTQPQPGQDTLWTIVGFCQFVRPLDMAVFGGNARRNTSGWFAQKTEVS